MNKLEELGKRVQKMLDGETKSRDVALEFVQCLQDFLEIAPALWGIDEDKPENNVISVSSRVYFRYLTWYKVTQNLFL